MISHKDHDDAADLVNRAALLAKLEMVAEQLDCEVEKLKAVVEEIKSRGGDTGDADGTGTGTDPLRWDPDG